MIIKLWRFFMGCLMILIFSFFVYVDTFVADTTSMVLRDSAIDGFKQQLGITE